MSTSTSEAPDEAATPFAIAPDGIRVRVRAAPRAAANRIDGLVPAADGGVALKVAVTAPPEDGKANAAVVKLLAREWGVAKSSLTVVAGAANRAKVLHLAGEPRALAGQLARWLAERVPPSAR